jgi:hypothetical protein
VQKVSALVTTDAATSDAPCYTHDAGYGTGSDGSGYGIVERTDQADSQYTPLSELLSPPAEPRFVRAWSTESFMTALGVGLLMLCCYAPFIPLALVTHQPSIPGLVWYGTLLALAMIGGVVVLAAQTRASDKRLEAAWQAELARWQAAMAKWEALYYCRRDDVVFFPGSPSAVPASSMWTVL